MEIKPIEIYAENSASQMCTDVAYYQNKAWEPDEKVRSKGFDRYDGMMKHFVDCIRQTIENEYTPDYELFVYKCVLKACGYNMRTMYVKNIRLIGSTLRSKSVEVKGQILSSLVNDIWPKVESGEVRPTVYAVMPITDAEKAHNLLEQGVSVGKVVLIIPGRG